MPDIVLDTSVAVKRFIRARDCGQTKLLLGSGDDHFAPVFALAVIADADWRHARRRQSSMPGVVQVPRDAPHYFTAQLQFQPLVASDEPLVRKLSGTDDAPRIVPLSRGT